MRRAEKLPWDWIVDNTRGRNHPLTFKNIEDALTDAKDSYRKQLWNDTNAYVEIWLEKDVLAGAIDVYTQVRCIFDGRARL